MPVDHPPQLDQLVTILRELGKRLGIPEKGIQQVTRSLIKAWNSRPDGRWNARNPNA